MFSTVRNLSVVPGKDGQFDIRVWPDDDRVHLSLSSSLDNCGTGISQALAILTIAMTMDKAVVVVDEISSFLHPAAAKALLRILQTNYADHQYVISTHSADVIGACTPSFVYVVQKDGYESTITAVNLGNLVELREMAGQLGVSMSDVFAADRVIWVEGATEELCFPYLFAQTGRSMPKGVMFAPVVATSDFGRAGKRTDLVFEIYERLSGVALPLVKSVTFGFDAERLSLGEMTDLVRRSKGRLHFLPRRHFECYLIHPRAIAEFICSEVGDLSVEGVAERVTSNLKELGGNPKYGASEVWNSELSNVNWLRRVDAAKLLYDVCSKVSDQRLAFAKGVHSLAILKGVALHEPTALSELMEYVAGLVTAAEQDSKVGAA